MQAIIFMIPVTPAGVCQPTSLSQLHQSTAALQTAEVSTAGSIVPEAGPLQALIGCKFCFLRTGLCTCSAGAEQDSQLQLSV